MPFKYKIHPKKGGRLTTSPDSEGTKTTDEFVALIMQRSGRPQEVVADILRHAAEAYIDLAQNTWRVEPLWGLIGMMPTSGGSHPTPDFPGTLDNLNASFTLYPGKEGNLRFAHNFTAFRTGEAGFKTAIVDRVTNKATGATDTYTTQKGLLIEGDGLRVKIGDPNTGIFFRAMAGGLTVRVADNDVLVNDPSQLLVLPPAGLTGEQTLIIKTLVSGSLRTFTYGVTLTH
jgi:hypothetical protein